VDDYANTRTRGHHQNAKGGSKGKKKKLVGASGPRNERGSRQTNSKNVKKGGQGKKMGEEKLNGGGDGWFPPGKRTGSLRKPDGKKKRKKGGRGTSH